MIPFDLRGFINFMSVLIFGGVIVSCLFAFVAYALAINRKKRAEKKNVDTDTEAKAEAVSRPPSDL